MSLAILNEKIDANRDKAHVVQRNYNEQYKEIKADTKVSDSYREELLSDLKRDTRAELVQLLKDENDLIRDRISDIEKTFDAHSDFTSGGIIALRDAQDRADAIKPGEHERALKLMQRSLRQGDKTLAHAIYRRAIDSGWGTVIDTFVTANPEFGEMARDLAVLQTALEQGFTRTMHYALASA